MSQESAEEVKSLSKEEVKSFLLDIETKVINAEGAHMHSVIALDQLLRLPNIESIMDQELKDQMHDLWVKLKSHGIQLADPPLLFGLPSDFRAEEEEIIIDDEPEIEIVSRSVPEDTKEEEEKEEDELLEHEGKLLS